MEEMQEKCSFLNISELEKLTGITFKTLKKRLGNYPPEYVEGTSHFYDTKKVLPLLYEKSQAEDLDLSQERAKLAAAQTKKTALETARMSEELIDREAFLNELAKVLVAFRYRLLALPEKLAPFLVGLSPHEIEFALEDEFRTVLTEFANIDLDEVLDEKTPEISP